jgi:hypothetical protein
VVIVVIVDATAKVATMGPVDATEATVRTADRLRRATSLIAQLETAVPGPLTADRDQTAVLRGRSGNARPHPRCHAPSACARAERIDRPR